MTTTEIREKSAEELAAELKTLKQELLNLRIQSKVGQLENTSTIRTVKKTIARILTELNAR